MTGKQLKEWASKVHDEAIVEMNQGTEFRVDWKPLKPSEIQAILKPSERLNLETVNG